MACIFMACISYWPYTVCAMILVSEETRTVVWHVWDQAKTVRSSFFSEGQHGYGLYGYTLHCRGLHRCCLHSYGRYGYGIHSHGRYIYGVCTYDRGDWACMVMARIVMAYRGRAYIVMAHIAMACTCSTRMPDVFARTVKGTEKDNEVINSLGILWVHDPRSESKTASC